jgi:hypothetical protein
MPRRDVARYRGLIRGLGALPWHHVASARMPGVLHAIEIDSDEDKDSTDARCLSDIKVSFGCADKPVEKHCWLIYCERKILFRLKKQVEKDEL